MEQTIQEVQGTIEPVVRALEADGYRADLDFVGETLRIKISAQPDVCEECLIPRRVLDSMVRDLLSKKGYRPELELIYPDEN